MDEETAAEMAKIFLEIVIAPSYTEKALEILKGKKNLRVIEAKTGKVQDKLEYVKVDGGLLVQDVNKEMMKEFNIVTKKAPDETEIGDMILGMKVVKHVKSNASSSKRRYGKRNRNRRNKQNLGHNAGFGKSKGRLCSCI